MTPPVALIVARTAEGVIGANGDLPWGRGLKADLLRFRMITTGEAVIMGSRTFESIGRALPERQNIVLSRRPGYLADGCQVARSLDEALDLVEPGRTALAIGGQAVYEAALPRAATVYETLVEACYTGDAFFCELDPRDWRLVSEETYPADAVNCHSMKWRRYERRVRCHT